MALLAEFFGGTPTVPAFVPINAQDEQLKAIKGNASALPASEALGSQVNAFNQAELDKMLNASLGGYYDRIRSSVGKNSLSLINGEIPQDVQSAVGRNAAARSLYGGYGGSGMARNLTARDLGLTSLDLMSRGLDSVTRWTAATRAPQYDVTSSFITPQQQIQFSTEERNAKFQHDYIQNQWDWYGSFGQQAVRFEDTAAQLAASMAGSMMGCWVAREVFGASNPKWLVFRAWLFEDAPKWFKALYLKHGERFAQWIKNKPYLKGIIRDWMESKVWKKLGAHHVTL